jgi:hypothetical protein
VPPDDLEQVEKILFGEQADRRARVVAAGAGHGPRTLSVKP